MTRGRLALIVVLALVAVASAGEDSPPTPAEAPDLVRDLADPDPAVRLRAAERLAVLGPDAAPAVDALWLAVRCDEEAVRNAALRAMMVLGEPAAKPLARWLEDPARRRTFEAELVPTAGPRVVPLLLALTEDDSWYVRACALGCLARELPAEEHRPRLLALLEDPAAAARLASVRVLYESKMDGPEVFEALLARRKDPHALVRQAALSTIGSLSRPAGPRQAHLLEATRDPNATIRHTALWFLRTRGEGEEVLTAFRRGLKEESTGTLCALALAERRQFDGGVPRALVTGLAKTGRRLVKPAFQWHAMEFGGRGARRRLGFWAPKLRPPSAEEISTSLLAAGKNADGAVVSELEAKDVHRRINAIWLMGRIGGLDTPLEFALSDASREVRLLAAIELAKSGKNLKYVPDALVRALHWSREEGENPYHGKDAPPYAIRWQKDVDAAVASLGAVVARPLALVIAEDASKGHYSDPWIYRMVVKLGPKAKAVTPSLVKSWRRSEQPSGLGHFDWDDIREARAEALRAIGPAAKPLIEAYLESKDETTREAAGKMLALLAEARVTVRIATEDTGEARPARVTIRVLDKAREVRGRHTGPVDPDGIRFLLPPGWYRIEVKAEGFTQNDPMILDLAPDERERDVTITLWPGER